MTSKPKRLRELEARVAEKKSEYHKTVLRGFRMAQAEYQPIIDLIGHLNQNRGRSVVRPGDAPMTEVSTAWLNALLAALAGLEMVD